MQNIKFKKYYLLLSLVMSLSGNAQTTERFNYTGSNQSFIVPAGVTSVTIRAWGAGGGSLNRTGTGGSGGSGAFVKGNMTVSPAQSYVIVVGGGGSNTSGLGSYGGGGQSGSNKDGSGGGYSGVFFNSVSKINARAIAGAGGGGGYFNYTSHGGAGGALDGTNAGNPQIANGYSGGGGAKTSTSTGGTAGLWNNLPADARSGEAGSLFIGGNAATGYNYGGGGGGGGYYGGGSGYSSGNTTYWSSGGGGGSSFTGGLTTPTNTVGTTNLTGTATQAPGNGETGYYVAGIGNGSAFNSAGSGGNGLVTITYILPPPTITLSTNTVAAGNITQNTNNNIIYSFKISAANSNATLTGLTITTAGNYVAGDVTNLKVRYSADTTLDASDPILSTYTNPGIAGSKTFPSFTNQILAKDATGYIFITTDTPCAATVGNTISASIVSGGTTFSSGSAMGTPAPGNTQTFTAATPVNVTGAAASVANTSSSVSWSAPTGCYSEVMIVAMPATYTGALPSGNGSSYTANLLYGSGTALGGGFIVYKGTVFPQNVTGLINGTKYYYKIFTRNGTFWSAGVEVSSTPNLNYCTPTTQVPNRLYINKVAFVGTMADPPVNSIAGTGAGTNGYSNFSTLSTIAKQAQGEGINVIATAAGDSFGRGRWRAWVDWNNNGTFESNERVYTTGGYVSQTANFGFKVPINQPPGNFTIRIRVNNGASCPSAGDCSETLGYDFGPCDSFTGDLISSTNSNFGETEDYLIQIVENYAAKITTVTPGSECFVSGGKKVTLKATASQTVTGFKWYDSETGSSFTTSPADGTGKATSFTTPLLSTTAIYYVTAYDAGGESTFRTAVKAEIKPTPEITFTPSTAESCGETSVVAVSAAGSKEIVYLVKEDFEDGTLGVFTNVPGSSNGSVIDNLTKFQNRSSVYSPAGNVWFPAISSGFGANKFALATSDVIPAPSSPVQNALTLASSVNATGFSTLQLKLKMYYSIYFSTPQPATPEYVAIDISTDGGLSYPPANQIVKFLSSQGKGSKFDILDYDLGVYTGQANLKFRILHYSWAGSGPTGGFLPDGVAVDDIELYGERPLESSFTWVPSSPIEFYSDPAGTIKYLGTPTSIVYIKPTLDQMEVTSTWNITANATLTNGCSASGNVSITNGNKIWPTSATGSQWNSLEWKPDTAVPNASHCVIIRKPVILGAGLADGVAKNITIASGGSLVISQGKTLTVTKEIINETDDASNFVVESDANLLQVTDAAVNTGKITVKRNSNMKRLDYTYWAAPVTGQNLKTFSPGTVNSRFYTYNEWDDKFTVIDPLSNFFGNNSAGAFESAAKGYAIRANNNYPPGTPPISAPVQLFKGKFEGVPNNGIKNITLAFTDEPHGYNLVGNPYSSNLDFYALHTNNSSVIYNTAYFWTNLFPNPEMQGSSYPGTGFTNNYAVLNGTGGVNGTSTSSAPAGGTAPNQFVKVGQGFIVKAKAPGGKLSFKNAIRTNNSTSIFFNKNGEETNRYWISQTTPLQVVSTQLIGYLPQATNGFELDYDAPLMVLGSDAFYSILEDRKLAIQGKASFINTDVVALGSSQYEAGTYTISLGVKEGIFANGQNIYLKDNQTNSVTNLTEGDYTFEANQGLTEGRFEIMYQPEVVLGTGNSTKNNLIIYRDGNDFVLKSTSKTISGVEVYDASGRLLIQLKPNQKEVRLDAAAFVNGTYVLRIDQEGTLVTKKIIK